MRRAIPNASSGLRAVPFCGWRSPSLSMSAANRSRSSARSIASGVVPKIGTPSSWSGTASFSGVCPPYWTMSPFGFSTCTISSTSSRVSGSK
jgi:hypothetical protein